MFIYIKIMLLYLVNNFMGIMICSQININNIMVNIIDMIIFNYFMVYHIIGNDLIHNFYNIYLYTHMVPKLDMYYNIRLDINMYLIYMLNKIVQMYILDNCQNMIYIYFIAYLNTLLMGIYLSIVSYISICHCSKLSICYRLLYKFYMVIYILYIILQMDLMH